VPSGVKLNQCPTRRANLYVGTTSSLDFYEHSAGCRDTNACQCGAHTCSGGAGPRLCNSRACSCITAIWSDDSGPKQRAPIATGKSAKECAFNANAKPCFWQRAHNGFADRHFESLHVIE
jgi:hypothetical protein